jgi:DNA-binding transcriptional LysR family regulator
MTMLRSLLRLGAGIAVMDDAMVAADVREGKIRRLLPQWHLPPAPLSIITPSRLLPAKTRIFIECVAAQFASV